MIRVKEAKTITAIVREDGVVKRITLEKQPDGRYAEVRIEEVSIYDALELTSAKQ